MSRSAVLAHTIDQALLAAVESGDMPGVAVVVADREGVVYEGVAGLRNTDGGASMTADTVFLVASMTKLATVVAALQLVAQGRLDLDAPVADLVPEFASLQVLVSVENDTPVLRPPVSAATVRQLLTHTSGLGYAAWHPTLQRYHELTGARELACGERAAFTEAPLVADPGVEFNYSSSIDWVGLVIESVSGHRLEEYWGRHVFEPLGLADTCVLLDDARRARAAAVHVRSPDGAWTATDLDYYRPGSPPPEFFAGGHCLYSTPHDYLRLQRALLAGGTLEGAELLDGRLVPELFANHLGGIAIKPFPVGQPFATAPVDLGKGVSWGLGQMVTTAGEPGMRATGSGGWLGLFNTQYWIDPAAGITAGIYTSTLPFFEPRVIAAARRIEHACYRALAGADR
ncbi:MAG: serine hydrolase domain-containing protein [Gaiellales bacterium]